MMRKRVIEIHQSVKGYKAILKAFGLQRTIVEPFSPNVKNRKRKKKLGTVASLPRSG